MKLYSLLCYECWPIRIASMWQSLNTIGYMRQLSVIFSWWATAILFVIIIMAPIICWGCSHSASSRRDWSRWYVRRLDWLLSADRSVLRLSAARWRQRLQHWWHFPLYVATAAARDRSAADGDAWDELVAETAVAAVRVQLQHLVWPLPDGVWPARSETTPENQRK